MISLLHFEEKVHRKDLAREETFPLLMLRLLSQVLEHLGFLEEPHIQRWISCPPGLVHRAISIHADLHYFPAA